MITLQCLEILVWLKYLEILEVGQWEAAINAANGLSLTPLAEIHARSGPKHWKGTIRYTAAELLSPDSTLAAKEQYQSSNVN